MSGTTGVPRAVGSSGDQGGASGANRGAIVSSGMGAKRRKYQAYRYLDDDPDALPEGYVNPMSQTYGSDKDLAPAKREDDGWDPRQW